MAGLDGTAGLQLPTLTIINMRQVVGGIVICWNLLFGWGPWGRR